MTKYTYTRTEANKAPMVGEGVWTAPFAVMLEKLTTGWAIAPQVAVNGNKASIVCAHPDGCVTAFEIEAA